MKLNYTDEIKTICSDKYAVREYIKNIIGEEYLIPLLGKLHNVRSKMNAFIYQFSCRTEFMEDEQIGELYYIENGEAYFDENDILRRELFEEGKDLFI